MSPHVVEPGVHPFLPPETKVQSKPSGLVRPMSAPMPARSTLTFHAHAELPEVRAYAEQRGWLARGWTSVAVRWLEVHWTCDGWATTHVLKSTDVPCPVVGETLYLLGVPPGTPVEFAVRVGVACRAPSDSASQRDEGDLWFNSDGQNFRQVTG